MARKKFGVDYPNLYAYAGGEHVYNHKKGAGESLTPGLGQQAADDYNAVQRAHQNTVENQPLFLALLLFGSLGFPAIAAGLGLLWLLARVAYSAGYYRAPKSRTAVRPPHSPNRPPTLVPSVPSAACPECSAGCWRAGWHRRVSDDVRALRPEHRVRGVPTHREGTHPLVSNPISHGREPCWCYAVYK